MSQDSAPTERFLAYVEFVKEDQPNRFARLRPIYGVDERPWVPIKEGDQQFLDEGLVFWWHPPPALSQGTLWIVSLISQPMYGSDRKHSDRYQVDTGFQPYQAVALQAASDPMSFRRTMASGQLVIDADVIGRPLVRVPGEISGWIELPESFNIFDHDGHRLMKVSGLEGVIPIHFVDPADFEQVSVDHTKYSLLIELGEPTGYQCALSDAQLIEHMRKRISSIDRRVLNSLGITKNLLREYVEVIEATDLGSDDATKEKARLDAASILIEELDTEVAALDEVVDALLQHPRINEELEAKSALELQERRENLERELTEEHQTATDLLSVKRQEIKAATLELEALHDSISTAVEDITEAPLDALARHGLLDALKRSLQLEAAPLPSTIHTRPPDSELEVISDVERLNAAASAWAYSTGVDPYVMQVSLAAVLAHRITLISGANAERLAVALASLIAGDCAVRMSVSTAVFGIGDLMKAPVSPVGSTAIDHVYTLGDFLTEVEDGKLVTVILSGSNRAPPEVVFPEFMPPLGDGDKVIGWSRDKGHVARVELSPRIKIIATLNRGDATYRIPPELSRQLGFVPADHREFEGIPLPATPIPPLTRIDLAFWQSLQNPVENQEIEAFSIWLRTQKAALPQDTLHRILTTYLHLMGDSERTLAEAAAGILVGRDPEPDLNTLTGTSSEKIRQFLESLQSSSAWREVIHYFNSEIE